MRAYGQFERTIIEALINIEEQEQLVVLNNVIENSSLNFPHEAYIDLINEHEITLYIRQNAINNIAQLEYQVSRFIVDVVQLFQYLEEQGLIFLSERIDGIRTLGERDHDDNYAPATFINENLQPILYRYGTARMFTTESLRALVRNNYKTSEEIRHEKELSVVKKELITTRIMAGISFLGLLASILIPMCLQSKVQITEGEITTKLSDKSISNIEKSVSKNIEPIVSRLNKLQQTFEHYTEQSVTSYATNKKLRESIKELANSINNTKQTKLKKNAPLSETETQAPAIKPRNDG